ncbi:MAG: uroporphyrinogen decarboxylase [Moraxella sp.]|nr:uroporphyrinogen decarboxylase [Moraxella sp.]
MTTQNFPTLKNDRLLRALRFEPVDTTPVWLMRQAGRYLPEYRQTRSQAGDFLSLCKNTELATEVTLQPLRRFELDGAILFSDILTIPDALGLGLYFEAGEGPKFKKTVRTESDIANLPTLNMSDLSYVTDAVTSIRHALAGQVPLFGFSGSAWTLATYMIEGGSSKDYRHAKQMMYATPELLHALLDKLADAIADYLDAQIIAGANLVQIFDSWGGTLGHREFAKFSHHYNRKVIAHLKAKHPDVPVVMFTKGGGLWIDVQADSQADALGFDWTMPLNHARQKLGNTKAIQGNLDPATLYGTPDVIRQAVHDMLSDVYADGTHTGYVANLGHGITQWANPDHAKILIDTVHEYRI